MYSWKQAGVWMKTGSRLEVDWKQTEETGSRQEVNWMKLEGDWFKSGSTKF